MTTTNYNYNSSVNQTIKGQFVNREVFCGVGQMVDFILQQTFQSHEAYQNAPFCYDDIENMFINNSEEIEELQNRLLEIYGDSDEEIEQIQEIEEKIEELEEEQETPQEVYEWYKVSNWFMKKLQAKGEVVIPHMNIWGRCCTGQAILLDGIISEICFEMEILEGQENDWSK